MTRPISILDCPANRRCFRLTGMILFAVLAVIAASSTAADREPVYRGQTLDTWFAWLVSGDDDVRLQAVTAIGEFGPEARGRAAEFAAGLTDKNQAVRLRTAKHLAAWEADAKEAAMLLAKAMRDIDPTVGEAAGDALKAIGKAASDEGRVEIVRAIEDRDHDVRYRAGEVMDCVGWSAPAVAALAEVMESKDEKVQRMAVGQVDDIPSELVGPLRDKVLARVFEDPGYWGNLSAASHVGVGADFAPRLSDALDSDEVEVRIAAMEAAGKFTDLGKPLAPKITECLEHENVKLRRAAALAIDKLEHRDARAVPVLVQILFDDEHVELFVKPNDVIDALGNLGPLAKDAVPQMLKFFASESEQIDDSRAYCVGKAIGKIGPEAVKQLAELLTARRAELRQGAARALAIMGPPAVHAVPQLAAFLASSDVQVEVDARIYAAQTLRGLGAEAKSAAAALSTATKLAKHQLDEVSSTQFEFATDSIQLAIMAEAWWRVDGDQKAIDQLVEMLDRGNASRANAVAAIYRSVKHPPKGVAVPLMAILAERISVYEQARNPSREMIYTSSGPWQTPDRNEVADMALNILSRLGADATPALDSMKRIAAEDSDAGIVRSAADAWWHIEPGEAPAKAVAKCLRPDRFAKQDAQSQGLVIQNTVYALEAMGEHAKAVVPELMQAYQQCDDEEVKAAVGGLLKKLDADAAAKVGVE
ncbi:MAG: HEAT repeat domain-containing protein [Pirellulales bacterium]